MWNRLGNKAMDANKSELLIIPFYVLLSAFFLLFYNETMHKCWLKLANIFFSMDFFFLHLIFPFKSNRLVQI
jgi:hypothetical protein